MKYQMQKLMFSSQSGYWRTPQDLFNQLDEEFLFDTDVCADFNRPLKHVQQEPPFTNWYDNTALEKSWEHRICFMNPPYGRLILRWLAKAYVEAIIKKHALVVALLPARTDTRWFWAICSKQEIRFIKGRLKFVDVSGNRHSSAPFPSMIVVFKK